MKDIHGWESQLFGIYFEKVNETCISKKMMSTETKKGTVFKNEKTNKPLKGMK